MVDRRDACSKIGQHVVGRLVTLRLILCNHTLDHRRQIVGNTLQHAGNRRQLAIGSGVPHHPGNLPVAAETSQAGEKRIELLTAHQLISRETKRVQVAGRAHLAKLLGNQLRCHVFCRALEKASLFIVGAAGKPKIPKLHAILAVNQQVAGLNVAVDHAVAMQKLQTA